MKKLISSLFAACIATASHSSSDDIMRDMIDFIEQRSKYQYSGEKLPHIEVKSIPNICKDMYSAEQLEQLDDNCFVMGYYNDNLNLIVVADNPGPYMHQNGYFETVLLHELVHYMQHLNNEDEAVTCKNELEVDAYKLQREYVEHKGYPKENKPDPLLALLVSTCASEYFYSGP